MTGTRTSQYSTATCFYSETEMTSSTVDLSVASVLPSKYNVFRKYASLFRYERLTRLEHAVVLVPADFSAGRGFISLVHIRKNQSAYMIGFQQRF